MNDLTQQIKSVAEHHGLYFFGSTDLNLVSEESAFRSWIRLKKNASMDYLEKNIELRIDPSQFFSNAKSALVFGINYGQGLKKSKITQPHIAQYAVVTDYHRLLKARLESLSMDLKTKLIFTKDTVCVDTKPVLERAIASKTTSGFIGKNTCFIHKTLGSYYLLGILITDLDSQPIQSPQPKKDGCGTCRRCQVHCPTGALDENYQLDANLCLSYWTIENRGLIPEKFWPHLKYFWYGCDLCQMVCPYNRNVPLSREKKLGLQKIPLDQVALMSQPQYEQFFGGTAMTRAKIFGLQRNALIALYVSQNPIIKNVAISCLKSQYPVVRDTAKAVLIKLNALAG